MIIFRVADDEGVESCSRYSPGAGGLKPMEALSVDGSVCEWYTRPSMSVSSRVISPVELSAG